MLTVQPPPERGTRGSLPASSGRATAVTLTAVHCHTSQTTAGTPTACTADGSVAGFLGRVVPRCRRHELLPCGAFVSSLSEHVSPEQSGGVPLADRLVGLVVRRPPRERKISGSNPACAGICSGSSHTSDFKIGTPLATLSGAWRYRVSTGTGRRGVSIL